MTLRFMFVFLGTCFLSSVLLATETNTVPFEDSFESYPSGTIIDEINGWSGSGTVLNIFYAYDAETNGYPLFGTHTNVLDVEWATTNNIISSSENSTWFDFVLSPKALWTDSQPPAINSNDNLCVYINQAGHLVAAHAEYGNQSNRVWTEFQNTAIATGEYNRVTVELNYSQNDLHNFQLYYNLKLNGEPLIHADGRTTTDGNGSSGGKWFPMLSWGTFNKYSVSESRIDDFCVANSARYPDITVHDLSVPETDTGKTNVRFRVSVSSTNNMSVIFDYATQNGSALAGEDYTETSGTATIPAGEEYVLIPVSVNGDKESEISETFDLIVANPRNARVLDSSGKATLENNDGSLPSSTYLLPAPGSLLLYEGFSYPQNTPLANQAGGLGWGTNRWQISDYKGNPYQIRSGQNFEGMIACSNACHRTSTSGKTAASRMFSVKIPTNANEEIWFSCLIETDSGQNSNRGFGFALSSADFKQVPSSGNRPELTTNGIALGFHIQDPTDCGAMAWENSINDTKSSSSSISLGLNTNYCIVGKIVWGTNNSNHQVYLYNATSLNKNPETPFASLTSVDFNPTKLDRLVFYDSKVVIIDEIRFAETFEELKDVDGDGMADTWEMKHFDKSTKTATNPSNDSDNDGKSNLSEFITRTDPNDSGSRFRTQIGASKTACRIQFQSASNRFYAINYCSDLRSNNWVEITNNIIGDGTTKIVPDPTATDFDHRYYRIQIQMEPDSGL